MTTVAAVVFWLVMVKLEWRSLGTTRVHMKGGRMEGWEGEQSRGEVRGGESAWRGKIILITCKK